ncbi:MAG: hypothetical protein L0Y50_06250 [Beijerinckiaceae bacterium]|nr:hypothetical protein [Beijerinckiaceae bacterium]MCI0735862.1 hypothetical protein [Beijerinckiaceae bacterium]
MTFYFDEKLTVLSSTAQERDSALLTDPDGQFARNVNRQNFLFSHGLKDHELFNLANLIELAKRPFHHEPYWSNGTVFVTDSWVINRARRLTLTETIATIADNNSIVILKHVEQDPVYGPVLQDLLAQVVALSGEHLRHEAVVGEVLILISSPSRITSYHMDAECNFLIQAVGSKTIWVYDHTDQTLVSHESRERYHMGNHNSIDFDEGRQCEATCYELQPGYGVHIPVFAPHWVRNHDNISVAMSVNYELRSMLTEKRLYRVNGVLRKFGAGPTPPGISAWRDRVKLVASKALYAANHLVRPKRKYRSWTPS